jgi:tRNA pseudouridine55 synthase
MQQLDQLHGDAHVDLNEGAVILVDKPEGLTSFDVVKSIRESYHGYVKKIGHTGTLDPMATGLLLVCTGPATKRIEHFQQLPKTYKGTFYIGAETASLDAETAIHSYQAPETVNLGDWHSTAKQFEGNITQKPPAYSAVKVKGKRAYQEAHKGHHLNLEPKPVSIQEFTITHIAEGYAGFRIIASKGTYVRSLVRDLAYYMGTVAYLTSLRREAIGDYTADQALSLNALEQLFQKGKTEPQS